MIFSYVFSGSEQNVFGLWEKKILEGLSKTQFTCPETHFEKKNVLRKLIIQNFFRLLSEKFSNLQPKFFVGMVKMRSTSPKEHFGIFLKKHEYVHPKMAEYGAKIIRRKERFYFRNLNYDGNWKSRFINCERARQVRRWYLESEWERLWKSKNFYGRNHSN